MTDIYSQDEELFLALEEEGGFVPVPVVPTTPTNAYVLEDGVTNYVAEDGATFYVQEV